MISDLPPSPFDLDAEEIDAVLEEFGGDPRAAIQALLHDLDALARDHVASVSYGFVRGEVFPFVRARRAAQKREPASE